MMKAKWHPWIVLVCLLSPLLSPAQFLSWDYRDIITDQKLSGAFPDMAVDPNGTIHITYWNQVEDRLIYAFKPQSANVWTREYIDASKPNGYRSAVALDNNNQPHVAYIENIANVAHIRYARRSAQGVWTVEVIPADTARGWGEYGPTGTNNASLRIKHSVDIIMDENQKPQIVFLDGWTTLDAFSPCTASSIYGLRLHQAIRLGPNDWITRNFGKVNDLHNSCGGGNPGLPLPKGDRYGEYAQLIQRADNKAQVFCLSRFNNRTINFQNDLAGNDTIWIRHDTDSLARSQPLWTWAERFFTFEGISVSQTPDENIHMSYTSSLVYGENFFAGALGSNEMIYSKIVNDTAVTYYSFGVGTYRPYTSMATRGNDSIFIAYNDLSTLQFLMYESVDGGLTWQHDTLWNGTGTYYSPIRNHGDSLIVLMFDASTEKLLLGHRHVGGGAWRIEVINESTNHGSSLDAYIEGGTYKTAYNDDFNGTLTVSTALGSGGIVFSNETLSPPGGNVSVVSLARTPSGNDVIAFSGGPERSLRLAWGTTGNWNYEIVDSIGGVDFIDCAVSSQNQIHVVYRTALDSCFNHASRAVSGGPWTFSQIDCDSLGLGQYPSLKLDSQGRPCVSYHSPSLLGLKYAYRDPGNQFWIQDTVHFSTFSALGKYSSLELSGSNLPSIAYLDEQTTSLWLAEKDLSGQWNLTMVDSVPVTNLGRPIELELDSYGKVWIAYNHYGNFERIKLLHRDGSIWREVAVSTTGQIANSFAFRVTGGDLQIFGKKNDLQNTGVAFLRAVNGVHVSFEPATKTEMGLKITAAPNPFTSEVSFLLDLERPSELEISIYDMTGRKISTPLVKQKLGAGKTEVTAFGGEMPDGMYIYRAVSPQGTISGRIVKLN